MTSNFESDFSPPRIFCLVLAGLVATLSSAEGTLHFTLHFSSTCHNQALYLELVQFRMLSVSRGSYTESPFLYQSSPSVKSHKKFGCPPFTPGYTDHRFSWVPGRGGESHSLLRFILDKCVLIKVQLRKQKPQYFNRGYGVWGNWLDRC